MNEINPEAVKAAPIVPEVDRSKELLNRSRVGLQASLLLDGLRPGTGIILERQQLLSVKDQINQNKLQTEKITNGSIYERDEYWKKSGITDFTHQKRIWLESADKFFESNKENGDAKKVLEALGMDKGAEQVYKEYFDEHKGDIGYFASKAARELSYEQIRDHAELLAKIGGFYGKDSAEAVKLLAEGAKNLKENDGFIPAAELSFNNNGLSDADKKILDGVHERNEAWLKKPGQEQTKVEEPVKKTPQPPDKPEEEKKTNMTVKEKEIRDLTGVEETPPELISKAENVGEQGQGGQPVEPSTVTKQETSGTPGKTGRIIVGSGGQPPEGTVELVSIVSKVGEQTCVPEVKVEPVEPTQGPAEWKVGDLVEGGEIKKIDPEQGFAIVAKNDQSPDESVTLDKLKRSDPSK